MSISIEKVLSVPALNVCRGINGKPPTITDILQKSIVAEIPEIVGLVCSLSDGWLGQKEAMHYMKATPEDAPRMLSAIKDLATYYVAQPEKILKVAQGKADIEVTEVDEKDGNSHYEVTKQAVLAKMLEIYFQPKKTGTPEVTAFVQDLRTLAGLAKDKKEYVLAAEYIVADCNRRTLLAPVVAVLNELRYPVGNPLRGLLNVTNATELPAGDWGSFASVNLYENGDHDIGRSRLRKAASYNNYVMFFKADRSHADFGRRTNENPFRMHLVSRRTGNNDTSAMIRAYMFAKCESSFPDIGLLAAFTDESDLRVKAMPNNSECSALNTTIGNLLATAGYCKKTGGNWSTMKYSAINATLPAFLEESPEIKKEIYTLVRSKFKLSLTAEERQEEEAKKEAQAQREAEAKARPDSNKLIEVTAGLPEWLQTLAAYFNAGKNAPEAERIIQAIIKNADEFSKLAAVVK